ncbi:MAG: RNA polymerase sigma factor YlaC [Phycisphaerales bacterium]|nr:RNA polymerase sigma factor YlaC [Phycisphaerales bacterium]
MVRAVLLAYCTPQDADDLVQEVFLKAMARLPSLRRSAAIGPWLAQIARREALSWRRALARQYRAVLSLAKDPTRRPGQPSQPCHAADDVLALIRRLPEEFREILIMRLLEQQSGPRIAAWTGRSHAAVRVALHRGLARLKELLASESDQ